VVNEINADSLQDDGDDWLACSLPQGFEWKLPAGKITPVYGDPIYVSSTGEHLSREEYIMKYNLDPEVAYQMMRGVPLREHMRASQAVTTNKSPASPALLNSVKKLISR
jgi:hypothetical protein